MDKKENTKDSEESCGCGMCHGSCGHWGGGGHQLIRLIVGIAILAIVLWVGMKIGEVKGELEAVYGDFRGQRMMWGGYDTSGDWNYHPSMMRNLNKTGTSTSR